MGIEVPHRRRSPLRMETKTHPIIALGLAGAILFAGSAVYGDQEQKTPADERTAPQQVQQRDRTGDPTEEYHIGAGDVLQISVWKEPDASVPRVVVRADGNIALPLVREVNVMGLTPKEVEKIITARLAKLIPTADVTVLVTSTNSKKIYLVGALRIVGAMPYTYRMTVMQALSEAGGLNENAKRKKIYILRSENGKDTRIPFDYDAAIKGEGTQLNLPLLPGDTLVVPPLR